MISDKQATTFILLGLALVSIIGLVSQFGDAASGSFSVTLNLTNVAPTITWVDNSLNFTPVADSTTTFNMYFNASDANGATDLDTATAAIVITLGAQSATSTACGLNGTTGNERNYNCTIDIPYYFNSSTSWAINASIQDNQGSYVENLTETLKISYVKAISLVQSSLTYDGNPGDSDVAANEGPQEVRNTGNYDFPELNLTGYDLNSSSDFIGADNFTVNVSNNALGQLIINNTAITIADANMTHGNNVNESLYIFLDIPSGITPEIYSSSSNWVVDAN